MLRIRRFAIVWLLLARGLGAAPSRADDPPSVASDSQPAAVPPAAIPPAADGTASVVVPAPPQPVAAADAPPAPDGPAGVPLPAGGLPVPPATAVPPPRDEPVEPGAAELLASVLDPVESGPAAAQRLAGRPLQLLEAVQRPGDPSRRLWIAQAYWKVSAAGAWVRWAAAAVERLELVAPGSDPHDRAVLDVATAAARADLAEARSQFGVAQQELVDLARLPIADPLPWPVDRPLASPYQTHFDAIFATRIATGRTRAIARTLPARHEAIESRAAAVTAAEKAAAMAEADHAKGRRPIEAVVAAHAALVGQQREFLAAVRAYNLDIAEYAMAVSDLTVPDDRFVSMLIGTPSSPAGPPAVPPSAPPPVTGPQLGGSTPP